VSRLQHKRGRKSNYLKSINNENQKAARERCLLRDGFQCRFPGCKKRIGLEMHHIDYKVLGIELEGDNLKWCVMLCEENHSGVHDDFRHEWNPYNPLKKPVLSKR
jgi:hypothetical protein